MAGGKWRLVASDIGHRCRAKPSRQDFDGGVRRVTISSAFRESAARTSILACPARPLGVSPARHFEIKECARLGASFDGVTELLDIALRRAATRHWLPIGGDLPAHELCSRGDRHLPRAVEAPVSLRRNDRRAAVRMMRFVGARAMATGQNARRPSRPPRAG